MDVVWNCVPKIYKFIKNSTKIASFLVLTGAGEEIRTLDPNLGKVMLYP